MWQKPREWTQRYAGYEPDLHQLEKLMIGKPAKMTLRALIDHVGSETRQPLRATKKVNGVRA
jgi:hypothetical protein